MCYKFSWGNHCSSLGLGSLPGCRDGHLINQKPPLSAHIWFIWMHWEVQGAWTVQTTTAENVHSADILRWTAIPPTMYKTSGVFINIPQISE